MWPEYVITYGSTDSLILLTTAKNNVVKQFGLGYNCTKFFAGFNSETHYKEIFKQLMFALI